MRELRIIKNKKPIYMGLLLSDNGTPGAFVEDDDHHPLWGESEQDIAAAIQERYLTDEGEFPVYKIVKYSFDWEVKCDG